MHNPLYLEWILPAGVLKLFVEVRRDRTDKAFWEISTSLTGQELGESKIIKKFSRMLGECEEGHVYGGKIIDFDTVAYVPKERLTKGMTVDSKEGPHREIGREQV